MASIDIKKIKTKQGDLPISATNYESDGTIAAKFTELETKINNAETQFFQTTLEAEENHLQAIVRVVADKTLHEGDIAVVKDLIAGDKFSYTSYVYDGNNWGATDGNYDADNVYFDSDLTYTAAIGVLAKPSSSATLATQGKSLKQVLMSIMAKESNPSATQPSTSITLNNAKAYEVGTEFTPTYSVGFNEGSYTYGPNTGVTVSEYSVTDTAEGYAATQTGSFIKFIVEDTTNYKVKVTVKHTAGTTPKTNLGNDYAAVQIQAGSKSAESSVVTGYRNSFYGTFTETKELNSDNIRTLTKSNKALSNTNTFTITVPVGAKRVVFAYPSTLRDVNSVKDVNGLNAEISSGFTKVLVDVEGFDKYTAKEYKVYYMDFANPNDKANSYTVVI